MAIDPSLEPLFEAAGQQYDIDPRLLRAVALTESSGDPRIPDSKAGAKGLMQFKSDTAQEMGVADPYDPVQAIPGAARYLAQGLAEGERLKVADPVQYALRYYNGGPHGPGNPATVNYVNTATQHYNALAGADAPANPVALAGMPAGAGAAGYPTAPPSAGPPPGGERPWPFPDLPVRPGPPGGLAPPPAGVPRMPLSLPQILSQGVPGPDDPAFPMGNAMPPDGGVSPGLQQLLAGLRPEDVAGLVGRPDLSRQDRMAIDQRLGAMQQAAAPPSSGPPPGPPDASAPMMMMSDAGLGPGLAAGGGAAPAAPPQAPLALPADLEALRNVDTPAKPPESPAGAPPAGGGPSSVGMAPAPSPTSPGDISRLSDDELVNQVVHGGLIVVPPAASTGLPGPPAMPTAPPGAVPMDSIEGRMARIQYYQGHGLPDLAGEEQKALDRMQTSGLVPYKLANGGVAYFPIPGGPADPAQQARTAAATAGGGAAGKLPYDTVDAIVEGPNGTKMKMPIPKDLWEQQIRAQQQAGAQPGAAAGAGTVNAAGGALGAPAGPPPQGSLTGAPVEPLGYGKGADRITELTGKAAAAQDELATVQSMRDIMASGLKTGWGADTRAQIGRVLVASGAKPEDVSSLTGINPADADAFQKQALRLSAQAVRSMGAREPGSVISLFTRAFPSLETQPGALDLMTNTLALQAQRNQDLRDAVVTNSRKGGSGFDAVSQAEADFDRTNPAVAYQHAAEAMTQGYHQQAWRGTEAQQKAVLAQIPAGRTYYDANGQQRTRGATQMGQ